MENQSFTVSLLVNQSPQDAFRTITNVREWWSGLYSEEIEGATENLNDEFTFRAGGGVHFSKQKLVELIPNKKIVWLVTSSELNFLQKKDEWTGTRITFQISKKGNKTQVVFTHEGLVPEIECFDACSGAWNLYLQNRLLKLLTTDNRRPGKKEHKQSGETLNSK